MKKNKRSKAVLTAIMAISVLASVLVLPAYAANENVTVGITSDPSISGAPPGGTATEISIIVYNVTDLGAGTLTVTYNPSVCNVTDVSPGDLPVVTKDISIPGIANISTFDVIGHSGNVTFANLTITAIGNPGETSPLNITVVNLVTSGLDFIDPDNISVSNGTFTILGEPTPVVAVPLLGRVGIIALAAILGIIAVTVIIRKELKK